MGVDEVTQSMYAEDLEANLQRSSNAVSTRLKHYLPLLFSLLARLSQDSNILRTFATDDEGIHDVEFSLAHALSCDAESHKEERMAASMTASATCDHSA